MTINVQDEIMSLLWEIRAVFDARNVTTDEEFDLVKSKIDAITNADAAMIRALKLKPTGDAYRDTLVSERINLRAE